MWVASAAVLWVLCCPLLVANYESPPGRGRRWSVYGNSRCCEMQFSGFEHIVCRQVAAETMSKPLPGAAVASRAARPQPPTSVPLLAWLWGVLQATRTASTLQLRSRTQASGQRKQLRVFLGVGLQHSGPGRERNLTGSPLHRPSKTTQSLSPVAADPRASANGRDVAAGLLSADTLGWRERARCLLAIGVQPT